MVFSALCLRSLQNFYEIVGKIKNNLYTLNREQKQLSGREESRYLSGSGDRADFFSCRPSRTDHLWWPFFIGQRVRAWYLCMDSFFIFGEGLFWESTSFVIIIVDLSKDDVENGCTAKTDSSIMKGKGFASPCYCKEVCALISSSTQVNLLGTGSC